MVIQEQLIGLCGDMVRLRGISTDKANADRDQVREKIQIIGRTAAFFAGFDGMTKLHNACETMTGNRNEIGDVLNHAWDCIGGWCA